MSEEEKDLTSHGQIQTKAPIFTNTEKGGTGEVMHVTDLGKDGVWLSVEDSENPETLQTTWMSREDYEDLLKQQTLPGFDDPS